MPPRRTETAVIEIATVEDPNWRVEVCEDLDVALEANHDAAVELFEDARKSGDEEFVYVRTCPVYGQTTEETAVEFSCNPESPHREAKLSAEEKILGDITVL